MAHGMAGVQELEDMADAIRCGSSAEWLQLRLASAS